MITGATGSMGAAACEALASKGIPVLMACRNLQKAEKVRADIRSRVPDADLQIRLLDLASLASVRAFAESIEPGEISAVFHNAGVISKGYGLTQDGLENTFSVNYFSPWLLTRLLLSKLPQDARIVFMVSLTCRWAKAGVEALHPTPRDFSQLGTYARAKRSLLSFALELAKRYPDFRINLADPGIVASDMIDLGHWFDPLADALFKPLCKKPLAGVTPALRALECPDGPWYFVGKECRPVPKRYIDPETDARIWAETEAIVPL